MSVLKFIVAMLFIFFILNDKGKFSVLYRSGLLLDLIFLQEGKLSSFFLPGNYLKLHVFENKQKIE